MAASKQNVTPSSYRETLDGADKVRYDEKLRLIGNEDPYTVDLSDWTDDVKLLPTTSYFDMMNYLVFSPSPYTMEDLRAYKGLEAYNQFVCGWVREKRVCVKKGCCVVTAKVSLITFVLNHHYIIYFSIFEINLTAIH